MGEAGDDILLSWQVHLFRKRSRVGALVLGATLAAAVLIYRGLGNFPLAAMVVLVTVASLSAFFFPIRYVLTEEGVRVRNFIGGEARRWDDFATYYLYPDGVQLAFSPGNLRGRILKGVFLYFDGHKDQVLEIVRLAFPEGPGGVAGAAAESDETQA